VGRSTADILARTADADARSADTAVTSARDTSLHVDVDANERTRSNGAGGRFVSMPAVVAHLLVERDRVSARGSIASEENALDWWRAIDAERRLRILTSALSATTHSRLSRLSADDKHMLAVDDIDGVDLAIAIVVRP
jgi:hypothetical protein